jgi:hypothetical protein
MDFNMSGLHDAATPAKNGKGEVQYRANGTLRW